MVYYKQEHQLTHHTVCYALDEQHNKAIYSATDNSSCSMSLPSLLQHNYYSLNNSTKLYILWSVYNMQILCSYMIWWNKSRSFIMKRCWYYIALTKCHCICEKVPFSLGFIHLFIALQYKCWRSVRLLVLQPVLKQRCYS